MTHVEQQIPSLPLSQGGVERVTVAWVGGLEDGRFIDMSKRLTPEQAANLAIVEARILDAPGTGNPNICDTGSRQRAATFFGQI
jgi:hypothetical protein